MTAERDTINIASHLAAMSAAHPAHPSIVVSRGRSASPDSRSRVTTFAELDALTAAGFRPVSIAANILRFETAAVAGLAIARAVVATNREES